MYVVYVFSTAYVDNVNSPIMGLFLSLILWLGVVSHISRVSQGGQDLVEERGRRHPHSATFCSLIPSSRRHRILFLLFMPSFSFSSARRRNEELLGRSRCSNFPSSSLPPPRSSPFSLSRTFPPSSSIRCRRARDLLHTTFLFSSFFVCV